MGARVSKRVDEIKEDDILDFNPVGKVTLLHICDMHAHLKPLYWREPSTLISAKNLVGTPGFCGKAFLDFYGIKPESLEAYFDTYLNFEELAKSLVKWAGLSMQGTAIAFKTRGEAIVDAHTLISKAIRDTMDCEIAFTPGYRWGTTLLPGDDIVMDNIYEMIAITYPEIYTF